MNYITKKGKKVFKYDDHGIKEKYRKSVTQRESLILQIIGLNPKIPHTHLIEMLLYCGKSNAKRTYEKLLNQLEENKTLFSEKIGNSPNAPRLWQVFTKELTLEKQFEQYQTNFLDERKKKLYDVKKALPILTDYQRALMLCSLLKRNNDQFMDVKFATMFEDKKKQFEHLIEYEHELFELMRRYPECLKFAQYFFNLFQRSTMDLLLALADELPTGKS